jgi:N-acetyl-alpha-D-muramate 1-phosphate uridylyltransferase
MAGMISARCGESRYGWDDWRSTEGEPGKKAMSGQQASRTLPPVCILAGGLGTRLGERVRRLPKALIEVAGEPFLVHQLRLLAACGAGEVIICVGYLGEMIAERIGSERFGLRIVYSCDGPGLDGTLGAIRGALPLLGEHFLTLYGDTYLRLDYAAAAAAWRASGLPAMMTVLRNEGRWDTSNVHFADGRVRCYDKRYPRPGMRWIDYGLGGLEPAALDRVPAGTRDLADLMHSLAAAGLLYGFQASERFYEIGTPAALAQTDAFLRDSGSLAGEDLWTRGGQGSGPA